MTEKEKIENLPEFACTFQNTILKTTEQSLYGQALGEKFIITRVVDSKKEFYSNKEILYRYYDHAERGQRQINYIKKK